MLLVLLFIILCFLRLLTILGRLLHDPSYDKAAQMRDAWWAVFFAAMTALCVYICDYLCF